MENNLICICGNDTWYATSEALVCTSCRTKKGDIVINQQNDQSKIIESMGIPPTLPNALELAQAHLDRLNKREQILKKIETLIEAE